MKWLPKAASVLVITTLAAPLPAYATWQIATNNKNASSMPAEPFFQAGSKQGTSFTANRSTSSFPYKSGTLDHPSSSYAISVSGSLKENVERIMDRYHWKVIWKSKNDYNFDGRVTGASLPIVISKLFKPFPLQAQLYMSNRTMVVIPRKTHEA